MSIKNQTPEPNAATVAVGGASPCSQIWLAAIFAAYSVAYEAIIWGVFGYAIFWQGHSGWWVLVALLLSGSQLKPKHFGIKSGISSANEQGQMPREAGLSAPPC